ALTALQAQAATILKDIESASAVVRQAMWSIQDRTPTPPAIQLLDSTRLQAREISDRIQGSVLLIALWSTMKGRPHTPARIFQSHIDAGSGLARYYRVSLNRNHRTRSVY